MQDAAFRAGSQPSAPAPLSPIFLTGGSGYLGRNLIRHFVAKGEQVIALARTDRAAAVVRSLGATACPGGLSAPGLSLAMQGCAVLIHAAANTDHGPGTKDHEATNVDGTRAVFKAARDAGIGRAVHISTESVLLDGKPLLEIDETHPMPRTFPGADSRTKAAAERIALSFAADGLDVLVVRPRFVWGRDDTTALPMLVGAARSGQLAWIGGGRYRTSTTHVANLCGGVELALQFGRSGEVYFLADERPVEFRDFISRLLETQGIAPPEKSVPLWLLQLVARGGEMLSAASGGRFKPPVTRQDLATMAVEVTLDTDKARRELGYVPKMSIEAGLGEMRASGPQG
jgi:nucleoside-diphosphate-sugar epimerase